MRCPVCEEPLIVVEREAIELDHCPWCRGLWFDAGELELLAERYEGLAVPAVGELPAVASDEERRRCPRCDRWMEKIAMGSAPRVLVDRCAGGHGLWFDHGEVGALLEQLGGGGAGGNAELVHFLGETFHAVVAGRVAQRREPG